MTLTKPETQFLNIAKAAISGTEISTDAVDWPALAMFRNCVSGFVRVMLYCLFIVLFNAVSNKQRS